MAGFHGQGVRGGISGVRLVGALGRDQTYVSTGNPSYRCGAWCRGWPWLWRKYGEVPGSVGTGWCSCCQKWSWGGGSYWCTVGPGKTQREKIFEAVEALRLLLGQGVGSQVEDLIQEHIPPPPKVTPPHSPTELERAQQLAKLLEDKARLKKIIQGKEYKVSKAGLAVSQAESDLSILQQEMRGLSFQIDAHHREDDARLEKNQSRGSLWRRLIVVRRLGSRLMGVNGGGLARVGLAVVRVLQQSLRITLWSLCVVRRRRTRPPSSGTWGRMEVTMCLLLRVINLKPVFVVRI